jgi:crotonobetainyl-CoA:carnitine CoA-transferase CaiB-like acyl-CoA transferase
MSVPKETFLPDAACPLDRIRVVDMSRLVAGNAVSSQLADFGAEVIKIEDPGKGDPLRAWQTNGVSVHWKLYARNKKSVALSLRPARGRELLLDLISTAEVLIENFRPGTLEKMGLAPAELHKRNPRLVIVRVSGWGQDDPTRTVRASGRWSKACRAMRRAPGLPIANRCCRRPRLPTWSPGFTAHSQ